MTGFRQVARWGLWAIVLAGALALRLPTLALRPMHTDEAVQAVKFGQLLDSGRYTYNPKAYHGPTLYYLTLPSAWLSGITQSVDLSESTLRRVPMLFGISLLLLFLLLRGALSPEGALAAAALTAVSPFMVYFSQYYIQETLLVFFTLSMLIFGRRCLLRKRISDAVFCGLSAGLMLATKETAPLAFFAAVAGLFAVLMPRRHEALAWLTTPRSKRTLFLALASALTVTALFFSSFLTHPRGPLDAIRAYTNAAGKAGGNEYREPFLYFWNLFKLHRAGGLWWGEEPILLLAVPAFAVALTGRSPEGMNARWIRFLSVYTVLLFIIYSLIPYKTPWLILGTLQTLILLGGTGWAILWKRFTSLLSRILLTGILAAVLLFLGRQAGWVTHRFATAPRNPCVYSHTLPGLVRGVRLMEKAATASPDGKGTVINVMSHEYWPLPWYLRAYSHVGYWTELPDAPEAPIMIIAPDQQDALEKRLSDPSDYQISMIGLRPNVTLMLYIRKDLWETAVGGEDKENLPRMNARKEG